MLLQVIRIGLQRLWHGKLELLLTFVVPIVFFTIFALIFDKSVGSGQTKPIRITAVNLDGGELSTQLIDRLNESELTRYEAIDETNGNALPLQSLDEAHERVLRGSVVLGIVIPEDWQTSTLRGESSPFQILADTSDPIAPKLIQALLQQTTGELLAAQRVPAGVAPAEQSQTSAAQPINIIDLLSEDKTNPVVSMYAAGIAVMFLLFSVTGAGGSLLEEEENQTLERLLCSRLGMTQLLLGKWLFLVIIGVAQVTVMFIWAQLVFGVDLLNHLPGFAMMTLVTSAAASSLALVLAAACRTRAQLNAVSVILILTMSALGGSMVPRYVMSDTMQQFGRITFNAWAIDGYNKLFWRDLPVTQLGPELLVLGASAIVLLLVARVLAMRWETA